MTWEKVGLSMSISCLAPLEHKATVNLASREDSLGNRDQSSGNPQIGEK
jgi:hypothetical protein